MQLKRTEEQRVERTPWAVWGCAYAAVVLMLLCTRHLATAYLAGSGLATLACIVILRFRREGVLPGRSQLNAALAVLIGLLVIGGLLEDRFDRIRDDWEALAHSQEERISAVLARRMATAVERGRRAATRAAQAVEVAPAGRATTQLFRSLEQVREQARVNALVVFTSSGGLKAWAGDHRGSIPDEVRIGAAGTYFVERPLYSYLYFTSVAGGRGERAVAALLVDTVLVPRAGEPALQLDRGAIDPFATRPPGRATMHAGPGKGAGTAWSLIEGRDTIGHARVKPITQAELRADIDQDARVLGVLGSLVVLVLLSFGWLRAVEHHRTRFSAALPFIAWSIALVIAPEGHVLRLERLYSPLMFVLTTPGDMTLGVVLGTLLPLGALVATARAPVLGGRAYALALAAGAVAVALGYPAALRLFLDSSTPSLFAHDTAFWVALQFAVVLLLTVITALALPRRRLYSPRHPSHWRLRYPVALRVGTGVALAALLGIVTLMLLERTRSSSSLLAMLWAIPFLLVAAGGNLGAGKTSRLIRWLTAGCLSATAVLPHFAIAKLNARLDAATYELEALGANTSPLLEYLLLAFAREAMEREASGEDGLQLLYRSWVASRLAREPFPVHIMLWSAEGVPEMELGLGGAEGSSAEAAIAWPILRTALASGEARVNQLTGLPDVTTLLAVPLQSGRGISVSVPPRRSLERTSAIAPFLGAPVDPEMRLTLLEAQDTERPTESIRWIRSAFGWRSEAVIAFPDRAYHAHVEVAESRPGMRLARGVLLLALDLVFLTVLWWAGNVARGTPIPARAGLQRLARSYRGRVTLALFGFFLVPTAFFGWLGYRALSGEVERSAGRVAVRTVRQAVAEFPHHTSDLRELAESGGTDVLRYLDGELADASSPETLELGVYGAWMPPRAYLALESREESQIIERHQVGAHSFLMAYHSVQPADALAVPTALSAGETAVRQQELAHLMLFAALIGGILSLALSVAVGRALAGPIGKLRAAAVAVGAGQLKVRLPEAPGEFGQLFASFNRMVRRLRRARAQELRTARVLAWGEMARQIAHEIKNPLTPIKLAVQHLRRAYSDDRSDFGHILDRNVEQILTEIDRLTEIARGFSRYGAPGELAGPLAPVDVANVVRESLTLYRAGDPSVRYGEDVEPELPPARARSGELKEVIINLLENARAALDAEGTVLVRAYQADGRIELEVHDNGPGIPPELLPRIFEPHFSMRSTGTGLGLPIVRRIVESWGGTVTAESEPGHGTTVRVRMIPAPESI